VIKFLRIKFPYILLTAICFLTFINTLRNGFVYDDFSVIADNPRVKNAKNIKHLFNLNYFKIVDKGKQTAFGEGSYRPAVTLTYFIDSFLWNAKPWGSHLSNLLFHVVNTLLLYYITLIILNNKKISLFSALFFTIHPVVTESVCAIGFREELLIVLFCLTGICFIHKKSDSQNQLFNCLMDFLCTLCYLAALFSKEMAIVFPIIIAMILYLSGKSFKENRFLFLMLAVVSIYYIVIRFYIMVNPNKEILTYPGGSFLTNLYTMATVFFGYLKLIVFPVTLIADHQINHKRYFFDIEVLCSLAIVLFLISCSIFKFFKKRSITAFGILWFYISLMPVSNIIKIDNIFAERYLYFPLLGISVFFGYVWNKLFLIKLKSALCLTTVIVSILSARSIARNNDWQNSVSLWKSTAKAQPYSSKAYSNLAFHYFSQNKFKTAIKYYLKCLSISNTAKDRYNLANCYRKIGDYKRAVSEYYQAIDIEDGFAEVYNNLGLSLIEIGKYDEAEKVLKKGLYYSKNDSYLMENLGLLYDLKGDYDNAEKYMLNSIKLDPQRHTPYNKLALIYFRKKLPLKALEILVTGTRKFPDNPYFYKNLAVYYHHKKDFEREIQYWLKAHEVEPANDQTLKTIIDFYVKQGDINNAQLYKEKLNRIHYEK